jgi:hypothetical protein
MDYSTLVTNIQDVAEDEFTTAQVDMFIQQAEQKIYTSVQFPDMRRNVTGTTSIGGKYLTLPTDLLYSLSAAIKLPTGEYEYLLNKDVNFIQEAYPNPATTGTPKHYSFFSSEFFLLGPTPDAEYTVELHYGYYPESIVTASTTWLGDQFDAALLNGSLVEAIRFQQGEPDVVEMYDKLYAHSMTLLKNLTDGRLRQDTYRSGQERVDAK